MSTQTETQANREEMLKLVEDLRARLERVKKGGGETAVKRHKERGKMFVRERIDAVIEPETPFLEMSALAANGMYDDEAPSAGIVTGIGMIHGNRTGMFAKEATSKGGTYFQLTAKSHWPPRKLASRTRLPGCYCVDSG